MSTQTTDGWCSKCGPSVPLGAGEKCPKCGGTARTIPGSAMLEGRGGMSVSRTHVVGIRQKVDPVMNPLGWLLVVFGALLGLVWAGLLGGLVGLVIGAVGSWLVDKATQRYPVLDPDGHQ